MNFSDAVKSLLLNYANFRGRTSRSGYWWAQLFINAPIAVFSVVDTGALSTLWSLAIVVPALSVLARRLHDSGKSAWLILLGLIPFVGAVILIVFALLPTQAGDNRFSSPADEARSARQGGTPSGSSGKLINEPAGPTSGNTRRRTVQEPTQVDFDYLPMLARNEFVAVDVEWTDSGNSASVCEIGLAKFVNGELIASWREYVRPAKKYLMAEYEFRTHGIRPELVDEARTLEELWPSIAEFIDGRPLVLHQATNDMNKIIASLGENAKLLVPHLVYLDTMLISKKLPWVTVKNGLSDLTEFFGIEREWATYDGRDKLAEPHGAKEDAIATGNVLVKMIEMVGFSTLLGFSELVGTTPGLVIGAQVIRSPSAPGKIAWPHLDELPTEESLIQQKSKQQDSYRKNQNKRTDDEQVKQRFLAQDPIPWSTRKVAEGSLLYFSSFPMDAEEKIKRIAKKLGVETDKFNAQIDLLVVDDAAVEASARLRNALCFKNPVAVSSYSNFLIHNPDFPPRNW